MPRSAEVTFGVPIGTQEVIRGSQRCQRGKIWVAPMKFGLPRGALEVKFRVARGAQEVKF